MKKRLFICFLIAGIAIAGKARAMHEKSSETRIEDLSKRIQKLEETATREKPFEQHWFDKITICGLVEAEAGYEKTNPSATGETCDRSSDIVLSTVELGLDAEFCNHVAGHALVLWEEDDTEPVDLDEGYISLTGTDAVPLYLHAGKQYIPFGSMDTFFISDPFTLELGETRESAVLAGYHSGMCNAFCGVFKGDVVKNGKEEQINAYFAGADFSLPEDDDRVVNMTIGVSYLSSLADSDVLSEANDLDEDGNPDGIRDYVGGVSAFLCLEMLHSISCNAECVCAIDKFKAGELSFADEDEKLRPCAWNVEVVFTTPSNIGFGVKYEGTDDCGNLLPETRYGGIFFCSPFDNTSFGLECLHQTYDNDDESDVVTAQLAFEF